MITIKVTSDDISVVTIEQAMEHSRITDTYDENMVQMALDSAHDLVEQWLNRKLVITEMAGVVECYTPEIILPYPPHVAIVEIKADDVLGEEITIPVEDFKFNAILGTVKINSGYRKHTNFTINFTCGYADTKCPKAVQHGIRMTFATLYEMREDAVVGTQVNEVPLTARNIIKSFRVRSTR